ncbi:hypothetical protein Ocin01_09638 [Orchesella cincta]|uniref:Uncharacterized protein n=1 Tax=Orchesella cincta TaxID=48709 RepID=A0A1D2MVF4_ORCCI|nr:hypothetical protein Ocin01_09638 [Orchesella cincta]
MGNMRVSKPPHRFYTTGATSATTKVPSLPTATTETTTTEGPPPGPVVNVSNFTTPVSVGNLTSEEIPDQIASGSDHEFVRISAPHHSIVAPDPDFVNTFTHVGSQQNDVEASELSHHEEHSAHGGFAPPTSSNFPQSFEKFGVQDTLRYKNEFAGVGGGVAGVAQSSGPSSTHSGEQHTPEFQTGFTITPQPPHLATTFQHSGGFSRSQGARSLGAPAQSTSGGAYQFSGGGLHEISPYGGSPSPPIQTVSPYNSPSHNNNNGAHQTHFAQHPPSTPPNFGALNNVQNNFAAAVPPSTGFHPANTNYDSWQPTGNVQPEAVFPGGAQRRSDPVSNLIKHKARQSHALNLEQEPQSSRTPSFGPPQSNSQEGSNEGFLGSFKTGDMPQELQNPDKKQNSGNRQQQMTSGSEEHFKGSPPDNSESLQQGSGGFNGFGPGGGPPAESNESQNFGGPPRGNSPPASHDSQLFGEPSAESHESQNFNAPPRSNYNRSPEPHSDHPQPFPDEDFPSKPHPQRSPNSNVGFAPSSNSQGFGDFGGFQGGNIPAPAKFQTAPEQPKFPNHPFHSPPSPGASVTFHGYDENELSDAPQQQQSAPEAPHHNHFPQPNWPNHDTPKHSNQQQPAQDPHHHPQSFGGFPGNNIQEPQAHHQHAAAPAHGGFPVGNQGQQHQPHYNPNLADFNGDSHPHQSPQHQSAPQDFHNFGPSQNQAGAPQGFNNFGPSQQQQGGAPQGFNNFQPPQQESLPVRGFANFRLPKPDAPGGSQGFANFEQPQGKPDAPQSLNYFQPPQPLQAPPPPGFNQFQTPSHSGSDESKSSSNEPDQGQPQNFGGFSGEPEETPNPQGPPPHENFGGFSNERNPATPQQHRPQHQTSATPGFGGFPGDNAPQHQPEGNGFQGFGKFPGGNAGLALKPAAAPPHSKFSSFQGSERDLGPYPPEGPLLDGFQDTESSSSDEHPVSVEQSPPPGFEAQGFNAFQHENSPFQGLSQNQQQNQHQNQPQHHYNNKQQPLFQQHHAHTPNYHNNQPIPRSEETPDIGQPHPPQQLYPSPGQIQNVGNEPQHHPQQGGGLGPSFHNAPNHPHQHHPNVEQFQNVQHPPYAPPNLQQQTMTNPIQNFGQNYPNQQHHPAGGEEGQNFGNNFPINQHNLAGSLNDAANVGHHFPMQQQHHPGGSVEEGPNVGQQFPEEQHHEGSVEENPNIGFNHNPINPQQHHGTGEPHNISPGGGGSIEFDQGNQGIANGPINNFNGGVAGAGLSGAFAGGIGPGPISNGQNQGISQAPFGGGPDGSGSIENGDGGGGHNEIAHYQSHGPENQGYFNGGGGGGGGGNPGLGVGLLKDDKKHGLTIKQKLKYPIVKVIKTLIELGHKILSFYAKFAIPKEHYLRVISFIGVYLLFAWLYKDNEHLLQPKCEAWGWNGPEEFTFHAPARFVPAVPVDQHMQREFLDLFRGVENCLDEKVEKDKKKKKKKDKKRKKNKDKSSSSSEEDDISAEADYSTEIGFINDMCPKGQFFYSMSPYHIEAWQTLARMFVAQKSPADVLHLAKSLLYSHSVNPKVWYLGLMAAAQERPDMTGFALAHPIDAIPDLFVPGHLIETELDRYRGIGVTRKKRAAFKLNSTSFADNTFEELLNGTLFLETGQAVPLFNETKKGQSRILRRNGESSEEDDEADDNDDDDDDDDDNRGTAQHKKKHPLGYGYGSVGDAYGGIGNSNRLKNKDKHKGDGGDDNDNDKDDKNKKGKGHGKKGHKKKGKGKKKDKVILNCS